MSREFRTRLIVNLTATLGILVVLTGLILYLRSDINAKADSISSIRGDLLSRTELLESLNSLRQNAKDVAAMTSKLQSVLPTRDSLFSVQRDFQGMALKNNLGFSSQFGSESAETPSSAGKIRLEMAVQGGYNGILEFIKGIDASAYFISIVSMDLVRQGGTFNGNVSSEILFHD